MSDFLPDEPETRSKTNRWLNPKEWKNGRVRVRFLTGLKASGWVGWSGGKPMRAPAENMFPPGTKWDEKEYNGKKKVDTPKFSCAAFVYLPDEPERGVLGLEVTQASLRESLGKMAKMAFAVLGPPTEFDVVLSRAKAKNGFLDYSAEVHESGKTPVNPVIAQQWAEMLAAGADMNLLYSGGDPFPSAGAGNAPAAAGDDEVPF